MSIETICNIQEYQNIAIMDTSSISFLQILNENNIPADIILLDYDLILIPNWVLIEINDAPGRTEYLEYLNRKYPIYAINEESYSDLSYQEEGNLYQIVQASVKNIGAIKSYLRRNVYQKDLLDLDSYTNWITNLYNNWPIPGESLSTGRIKKKNAGEISITILAEVISWYYPSLDTITIYSQDRDTYEFQRNAEECLIKFFKERSPVPVSYKSNDSIICQLYRNNYISLDEVRKFRKDCRKLTYTKKQIDQSNTLINKQVNLNEFIEIIQNQNINIIF